MPYVLMQEYIWLFWCAGHGTNSVGDKPTTGSEPQVVNSNVMDEGSGVATLLSVRTET